MLCIRSFSKYVTWEGRGSRQRKQQKMTQKGGRTVKKVISLTQVLLLLFSVTQFLFVLGVS